MKRKKERILVTGGAGAIGSNLVKTLLKLGHEILIIDNLLSGSKKNIPSSRNVKLFEGEITDDVFLEKVFKNKVDRVFHLAAFFANQNSVEHPEEDLLTNSLGTLKLLRFSKKVKSFLLASTSCFYEKSIKPLDENMDFHFETPYAISKFSSEHYAKFYHAYYHLPVVIVRYFNSYGPGETPGKYRNVIPNFIFRAMQNKSIIITGSGQETRSFTYVDDIIDGTLKAAYSKHFGEVFNIGNPSETKIIDLANMINKIASNTAPIVFHEKRRWDSTTRKRCSIRKAKRLLGYKPKIQVEEGLNRTYEWLKAPC